MNWLNLILFAIIIVLIILLIRVSFVSLEYRKYYQLETKERKHLEKQVEFFDHQLNVTEYYANKFYNEIAKELNRQHEQYPKRKGIIELMQFTDTLYEQTQIDILGGEE